MEKTGFLEESPGQKSSTRLAMFITLFSGIAITILLAYFGIKKYLQPGSTETLMSVAQAVAFLFAAVVIPIGAWKVSQKAVEQRSS